MDYFGSQRETVKTASSLAARVAVDARRAFGDWADDGAIDRSVRQAVNELTTHPLRVTSFVPVLALRRVRELLETTPLAMMEATADV